MKFKAIFQSIVCVLLLSLGGCGEKKKDPNAPYIVMTSPDNPPFEYVDTSSGSEKIVGFDIEMMNKIADHLGWKIEVVPADFASLIPAIQSGRADMVIASMVPTPEREKSVDFSTPYYQNSPAFLIRKGATIQGVADLTNRQVGVQLGSTHEQAAKKLSNNNEIFNVLSLTRIGDLVQELKTGRIDAVLIEKPVAEGIIANNPDLAVIDATDVQAESPAIAFPNGSPLVVPVNKAIEELKSTGVIESMAKLWFSDHK
ncbi:Amino acid ABC transporter substrate-binding protein [Candidatus Bealeia paramacronuclearis]|uniref:Amino acid ABC transporter substrate-binding protein n=1 Tax=Candidatus Bealeia paramacronuclearis TaxID=1921001 RepID=A0ABZ2C3A6_9PROT|nr:Amino acid ABC transporter substrate-binding protein [Candidatus Bealeia paramacronuclearis]